MPDQLKPFRTRIDRAKLILDALDAEVRRYFQEVHPHRILLERDPGGADNQIIYMEPPDELPSHWPLVVGEILHEIRSALDNLAWFLAETNSGAAPWPIPPGDPWRSVQFPVRDNPGAFASSVQRWRHLVHDDDWTILESVQPYNGLDPHHLVQLNELSNADKHRAIPLLTMFNENLVNPAVFVTNSVDVAVNPVELAPGVGVGVCRGKTELGRLILKVTGPNPHVEMGESFGFEIAVDHPVIVPMTVTDMTMWMQLHARQIIDMFAARYP